MDFGEILSKAWKTIWKHKILWLFGLLAGCGAARGGGGGGGGGSGGSSSIQIPAQSGTWNGPPFLAPSTQRVFQDIFRFIADIPAWVWVLIALVLLVVGIVMSVLFLMAGTLGTAGVIKGAGMADDSDALEKPLSFGEIFKAVKPYYWKVFLLNLGLRILGFIAVIFLLLPIILVAIFTCGLGLFLLIPIGWFIELMVKFTTIAIIEEDKGIFDGINRAWSVITQKVGQVIIMFLILGIGQLIVGLIISLPLFITPVPILINLLATGFRSITVGLIISGILFLAFIPLVIFLGGVLQAYVLTSWTLTYRRLTGESELIPTVLSEEAIEEDTD